MLSTGTMMTYSAVIKPAFPAEAPLPSPNCCAFEAAKSAAPLHRLPRRMSRHLPHPPRLRSRHTGSSTRNAMKNRSALMVKGPRCSEQRLWAEKAAPQIMAASSGKRVCRMLRFIVFVSPSAAQPPFLAIYRVCSSFSSAAIFTQRQKISMACRSSSTGGREGAIRILLSCGSTP